MASSNSREDDVFSPVGGFEMGADADQDHAAHLDYQASCSNQGQEASAAEPSRTLVVHNVAVDASDEELKNIFQVCASTAKSLVALMTPVCMVGCACAAPNHFLNHPPRRCFGCRPLERSVRCTQPPSRGAW